MKQATVGRLLFIATLVISAHSSLADTLNLSGGVPGVACANPIVNSGSALFSCPPSTAFGLTGTASGAGNLSTGSFGVQTSVSILPMSGGDTSANVFVTYNFAESGVLNGTAQFDISAMGSLSSTLCQDCAAQAIFVTASNETVNGASNTNTFLGNGTTSLIVDSPIGDGTTQLFFGLEVSAACDSIPPNYNSCVADADFLDPLSITGASVYNSDGNIVPSASLVSESGFNPNAVSPPAIPEPCSSMLLGTGILVLIGLTKFKSLRLGCRV